MKPDHWSVAFTAGLIAGTLATLVAIAWAIPPAHADSGAEVDALRDIASAIRDKDCK